MESEIPQRPKSIYFLVVLIIFRIGVYLVQGSILYWNIFSNYGKDAPDLLFYLIPWKSIAQWIFVAVEIFLLLYVCVGLLYGLSWGKNGIFILPIIEFFISWNITSSFPFAKIAIIFFLLWYFRQPEVEAYFEDRSEYPAWLTQSRKTPFGSFPTDLVISVTCFAVFILYVASIALLGYLNSISYIN